MFRTFIFWTLLAAVVAIATEIALAIWFWPTSWENAQQAALASALVTISGGITASLLKLTFEELSTRASHERAVKVKLLERFLENRAIYLEQLNAVAGDLAVTLEAVATYPDNRGHLDFAFYYSARYIELVAALRSRFQRLVPPEHMPGFVLQSEDAEERIWDLLLEPWAFGYTTLAQHSALLESLRSDPGPDGKRALVSPQQFLEARDAGAAESAKNLHDAWVSLKEILKERQYARAMAKVLLVLNGLLTYEMATVLQSWYGKPSEYPSAEIRRAQEFFDSAARVGLDVSLEKLGVTLPPVETT